MFESEETAKSASTGLIERRRGRRFNLKLNCRMCPVLKEEAEAAGTVINISRTGILMALASARLGWIPRIDDIVRVEVDLPRHPLFSPRFLECSARVVRVIVTKAHTEVAVEIGQMQIVDQGTKAALQNDLFHCPGEQTVQ